MAKSKSSTSSKSDTSATAKGKSAAPSNGRSTASAARPARSGTGGPRALTAAQIGHVAGDVWGLLSRNGEQTLSAIKKQIDAPADVVAAAIGWLSREDKLEFTTTGRQVKISLR